MMRRSKIKVRPAIKQTKPSSKPNATISKPKENSPNAAKAEVKKEINTAEKLQVQAVDTLPKPVGDDVDEKSIPTEKISVKFETVNTTSPVTKPSITRRRKLVACPTMARKKPKLCSSKAKVKESNEQKSAIANADASIAHEDAVGVDEGHPTIENAIIATPVAVPVQQVECDTIDDTSTKDFVTLTPASQLSINAEADLNSTTLSQTFATSTQKNEEEDDHSKDNRSTENVLATKGDGKTQEPDFKQTLVLFPTQENNTAETATPAPSKAAKSFIPKAKSATAKHRDSAMAKLKKLKQEQEDGSAWPELDQNVVSISDLIFLNPPNKTGFKLGMNIERENLESAAPPAPEPETAQPETTAIVEEREETPLPVPQIRIAADGSVVVDEESLVLDTQKPPDPKVSTVYEFGKESMVNQCSFMRRAPCRTARWSQQETDKFYKCLCVVGAEFSLMSAMFKSRTAADLRRKFRRERKSHPSRVDNALKQQHLSKWTDEMFEHEGCSQSNDNILKSVTAVEETVE